MIQLYNFSTKKFSQKQFIGTTINSIIDSLGTEYGEAKILDLDATRAESEPRTPLICILSIGSDPSPQITALAKAKEIGKSTNIN